MKKYHLAIVGATGAVGTEMIRTLHEQNFPIASLRLLASKRSVGKTIAVNDVSYTVEETTPEAFEGVDIALFSAGGDVSAQFAPEAVKRGTLVIDNTSYYRMDPTVPLVVPEVNKEDIWQHQGIIANPNCSTIQMLVALAPIHARYGIEKIVVSTYQAVSGTGQQAMKELQQQYALGDNLLTAQPTVYPYPIAGNLIPQIDTFLPNGFTKEEMKMVNETKKIFHDDTIQVAATCVRVPVMRGHSESIYIQTKQPCAVSDVTALLHEAAGVVVQDDPQAQVYPMPLFAEGHYATFVGRLRQDLYEPNGLHLWVVADNLLKGAALNAVQIAQAYIEGKKE